MTQENVNLFAEATLDRQWIHTDTERAGRESPFKATIAHGFLTLSMISYLFETSIVYTNPPRLGVNYGLNKVRFIAPVFVGAKIRLRATLQEFDEINGGTQMVWNSVIEAENLEKPCCIAENIFRCYD